ncbi:hypothetical protein CRG98_021409, partial [Punica granatum]
LLDPGRYTWLLKVLYGLLMLLPQQSAAFKILRTRLKTVPPYSFSGEQIRRTSSGTPYSQRLQHMPSGSQIMVDGDLGQDSSGSLHNGINFAARLQQFEQMQRQHRLHAKLQSQKHRNNPTSSKEQQKSEEQPSASDISRPPSRTSRRGPGQLQL